MRKKSSGAAKWRKSTKKQEKEKEKEGRKMRQAGKRETEKEKKENERGRKTTKCAIARKAEWKRRHITRKTHPKSRIPHGKDPPRGKQDNKDAKIQSGTLSGVLSPKLGIGQRSAIGREGAPSTSQEKKEGEAMPGPLTVLRKDTPAEAGEPKRLKRGGRISSVWKNGDGEYSPVSAGCARRAGLKRAGL